MGLLPFPWMRWILWFCVRTSFRYGGFGGGSVVVVFGGVPLALGSSLRACSFSRVLEIIEGVTLLRCSPLGVRRVFVSGLPAWWDWCRFSVSEGVPGVLVVLCCWAVLVLCYS